MFRLPTIFAIALLLLTACGTSEVLEPIDGTVPSGIDLSGNWLMRDPNVADQQRVNDAIRKTDGMKDDDFSVKPNSNRSRQSKSRKNKGGLVHVFLETGTALKVTQTAHGVFVSFDRSVVEEYRFGESRIISVGQVEAQRVTGWKDDRLVIETLDKNSMKLTENYRVIDGGQTLERTIIFRSRDLQEETIIQEFDRTD
ncbi:MAG: hypothetical protein ACI88G_000163 [Woeseiaceae bacterium]|jgi:hypothetical protein